MQSGSAGPHHEELVAVAVRVAAPDVDLALRLVGPLPRVRLPAVVLAEDGQVLESERSRHLVFAVEQRLPASLRLRVEAYRQSESRRIFNRELDWRLEGGRVVRPSPDALLLNNNEIDSVNPATGRVRLDRDTMLPLIPLFGATVIF